jgi:hypothetical protein
LETRRQARQRTDDLAELFLERWNVELDQQGVAFSRERSSFGPSSPSALAKQVADGLFVVDNDMQVRACHGHIAVPCGSANLCQRTSARESVANERVSSVVDGQRLDAFRAEHPTRRQEPPADGVTLKRLTAAVGLDRADERISSARTSRGLNAHPVTRFGRLGKSGRPGERHIAQLYRQYCSSLTCQPA